MRCKIPVILLAIISALILSVSCDLETGTNKRPDKPELPTGPDSGYVGTSYSFTTSTTDPNNDNVYYQFDWDGGNQSFWSNFVASGTSIIMSHTWQTEGTYSVKARAKDIHGLTSLWSDKHQIVIISK
jgi:hypothetical protein